MNFARRILSGLVGLVGERFEFFSLRCAVGSFALLAGTWVAVWCLRRRSAALRHRVLSLGLAGVLCLPAVLPLAHGWHPTLRLNFEAAREFGPPPSHRPAIDSGNSPPIIDKADVGAWPTDSFATSQPFGDAPPSLHPREQERIPIAIELASRPANPWQTAWQLATTSTTVESLFAAAWIIGALLLCVRLVAQRLLIEKVVRKAIPITDARTRDALNRMNQCEIAVRLLCSDAAQVPVVVGIVRPAIVLPTGYGKWSDDRLRVVLRHELAHIDRRDVLAQAVARVACVLHWPNPLAWRAARRMRLERELACDDAMLCLGENANDYVNHLVEIASAIKSRWRVPRAASAMATHANLQTRVHRLLRSDLDRRLMSKRLSALLTAAAIASVALAVIATPSIATTSADDLPKADSGASATEWTLAGDAPADWFERLKAMPNVRKLTVRRPNLKHFSVRQLKELRQLTSVRAEDFPLESPLADAVAANIASLPALDSVTFHRTGLTSRGLERLRDSSITELVLEAEEFLTDDAFEHVANMKSLRTLVLDSTPIEVAGFEHLQRCPRLRSFALRRHPAGSIKDGADERLAAIAGIGTLEELELESTGYERLVVLERIKSLKQLTLRRCGATEASQSLKHLKQLDKLVLDSCDIRNETFGNLQAALAEIGIEVVDATRKAPTDLLTRDSAPVNEATKLARRLHDELDIAKHHPSFWIRWRQDTSDVPSMKAEPIRTVYRLKKALSAEQVRRPFAVQTIMAWAPKQFYFLNETSEGGVVGWEQIEYGNAKIAWARERRPGEPPNHFIRSGVSKFVDSLVPIAPQLHVSQQSYWWGAGTHHSMATSAVAPRRAIYDELPAEEFAGETCRVLESAGRSERLWVSQQTGRLRGSLSYIYQGYFEPFHEQNIVTQVVGHPITSLEAYQALFGDGGNALPEEKQRLLRQAWFEYMFDHGFPGHLNVFSDFREIAPSRWFAFRVQSAFWHHNQQNQGRYDFHSSESVVTEVALDRDDLRKHWADDLPKKGENVQDQRHEVPVNFKYGEDRGGDELEGLLLD